MISAPDDPIWQMVAIINGRVGGGELVMVISAFVDESGTGDEPNVVLAAVVSDVSGWLAFNPAWQKLLDDNHLTHTHFTDMRNNRREYKVGWDTPRKDSFSRQCLGVMKSACRFGFTVSLNKALHAKYLAACKADRVGGDSAYAICARHLIGLAIALAERHLDYTDPINFIFESGHKNASNAAAVFDDLKTHSESRDRLGFFALEDKKKLKPLQAADHIAHQGRRNEAEALANQTFVTVEQAIYDDNFVSVQDGGCPFFYFSIGQEELDFYRGQHGVLKRLKRRVKGAGEC